MIGVEYDLTDDEAVYQGASWKKRFQLINEVTQTPYDLTGCTVTAQARRSPTDPEAAITFEAEVIETGNGLIQLSLTYEDTAAIPAGTYRYGVEVAHTGGPVYKAITPSLVQVVDEFTK